MNGLDGTFFTLSALRSVKLDETYWMLDQVEVPRMLSFCVYVIITNMTRLYYLAITLDSIRGANV